MCVRVLDENDWAPTWENLEYKGSVLETAEIGSPVLLFQQSNFPEPLTVKAADMDSGRNGRVTYSIVERNVVDFFSIDKFTGLYRLKRF